MDYFIIGDVHGCFEDLIGLIEKVGFTYSNGKINDSKVTKNLGLIFCGDLIDKADDEHISKTIDLIYNTLRHSDIKDKVILIKGNHEEMVYRWITNDLELEHSEKRIKEKNKYYNTVPLLESDNTLKSKFFFIYNNMVSFFEENHFIVTHAPCEEKYLGKADSVSLYKQMKSTSRSKNKDKTIDELTPYLKAEANDNKKLHIFGHLGQKEFKRYKNKLCIDSGCVYGYTLTGVRIKPDKTIQTIEQNASKKYTELHATSELFDFLKGVN